MATDQYCGPIDYLVFAIPPGADPGAGLLALLERVEQGVVEVLDLEFVRRGDDDRPIRLAVADVLGSSSVDLAAFDGVESGILDADDLATIAAALEPGHLAVAVVYEDRSLAAAAASWSAVGGAELFAGGVDIDDLDHALEEGTS